jgi:hypothetical protein
MKGGVDMRKLGKVGKKENTSLKSIVGMCTCLEIR